MNAPLGRRALARALAVAIITVVAGASSARTPAASLSARRAVRPPPPPPPTPIVFTIEATPSSTIRLAQRTAFRLWLVARNAGTAPVDTQRDSLEWYVNGQPSMQLNMAFGNGVRTNEWSSLAPGATVREARAGGEWLFPSRGTYVFSLRRGDREIARRVVTVR